jgi:hypothetical protein
MFNLISKGAALTPLLDAALSSVARLEAAGEKPARITDPDHQRWARFRRSLGWRDYVEVLLDDAAGSFPEPFDLSRWAQRPLNLTSDAAELLVRRNAQSSADDPATYLRKQAEALGLSSRGALSDLPVVQPRETVLELPGSGGRLMAHLALSQGNLDVQRQFTLVAATPAERLLIGLSIVEARANAPTIWTSAALPTHLEKARFDRVFGLTVAADGWAHVDAGRLDGARLV